MEEGRSTTTRETVGASHDNYFGIRNESTPYHPYHPNQPFSATRAGPGRTVGRPRNPLRMKGSPRNDCCNRRCFATPCLVCDALQLHGHLQPSGYFLLGCGWLLILGLTLAPSVSPSRGSEKQSASLCHHIHLSPGREGPLRLQRCVSLSAWAVRAASRMGGFLQEGGIEASTVADHGRRSPTEAA